MELETNYAPIPYEDNRQLIGFRLTADDGTVLERGDMEWTQMGSQTPPKGATPSVKNALRLIDDGRLLTLSVEWFGELSITAEVSSDELDDGATYDQWTFDTRSAFEQWATEHVELATT